MKQIQFQMKEEAMEGLKAEAAKMGITPNILARIIMNKHFSPPGAGSKSYTITVENWREVEAYVKAKGLGSVEVFAGFAMERYMAQYPPKEPLELNIEK
jgi:hypothetical protein